MHEGSSLNYPAFDLTARAAVGLTSCAKARAIDLGAEERWKIERFPPARAVVWTVLAGGYGHNGVRQLIGA